VYANLLRLQHRILLVVTGIIFATLAIMSVTSTVQYNNAQTNYRVSQREGQFWLAVAGEGSDTMPVVASSLARDLNEILGNEDAMGSFIGSSNRYGGITEAVGFDPFDSTGLRCNECGPLSAYTVRQMENIDDGGIAQVLGAVVQTEPVQEYRLTPFGASFAGTFFLSWMFIGSASLLLAAKLSGVKLRELDWDYSNGKQVPEKIVMTALAPPVLAYVKGFHWSYSNRLDKKLREQFPEQMELVSKADELLEGSLPDHQVAVLRERREKLFAELTSQLYVGESPQVQDLSMDLDNSIELLALRTKAYEEL
jgi:hypothetical protein